MLKKFMQLGVLVIVPLLTLIGLLNSGAGTSFEYGRSSATRVLTLDAKRNGDVEIELDGAKLLSKNFLDFEFDQQIQLDSTEFDYQLDCHKIWLTPKIKQLNCEFDTKRGERVRMLVKRKGFIKVSTTIEQL